MTKRNVISLLLIILMIVLTQCSTNSSTSIEESQGTYQLISRKTVGAFTHFYHFYYDGIECIQTKTGYGGGLSCDWH